MDRVVIVGVDSVVGRSLAGQLSARFSVTGLCLKHPEFVEGCPTSRIEANVLAEQLESADVVIFCGGAARSSWDSEFGDFDAEAEWLKPCVEGAKKAAARLVFVSSDAVFDGPWVFHDDDSGSYSARHPAIRLRDFESVVAKVRNSLIVRTNVVGVDPSGCGFINRILERLDANECEHVDAGVYSTPIAAQEFAIALCECVITGTAGVVNIGGAERTTPFTFAISLAASLGIDAEQFVPSKHSGESREQSMRCERLRSELNMSPPMLKETVEQLASTTTANRQAAAA